MRVTEQLQRTEKGRLYYERDESPKQLKDFLNSCTSPPSVHVSPNFTRNHRNETEQLDDESIHANNTSKPRQSSTPDASIILSESGKSDDLSEKNASQPYISAEFSKSNLAIQNYEKEAKLQAKKALLEKKRLFEETKWRLEKGAESLLQKHEQQANFDCLMKIQTIELRHESQATEIDKQQRKLKETHEQRKMAQTARMQEAEETRERLRLEEQKRKEHRRKELLSKINKCISDLNTLNAKLQSKYSACQFQNYISEAAKKSLSLIQSRVADAEKIETDFKQSGEPSPKLFEKCKSLLEQAGNAYEFVCKEIDNAEKEGKKVQEEAERQAKLQKEREQVQLQQQQAGIGEPLATSTPAPSVALSEALSEVSSNVSSTALSELTEIEGASLCIYPRTFTRYTGLMNMLRKVEEAIAILSSTSDLKKLKFDIQKAVNTPVNAISPVSGDHLRDKLKRLLALLSGQAVEVGNKHVSLKQHPQAPDFCKHLIAKMIVKKGQEQVSSKHESAFAIAMVVVGLWREQPDLGDLLLAQFYQACPYLVPYYIPKQEDQSNEEYLKSRGYLYDSDGVVEKQEKFLKRMSGIMRLYFSILVSFPPRGTHPHGLEYAWSWFSQVLNLDPEPDITATMIYDFLQVVGHALYIKYNRQFFKLLHILAKETVPKLERVSSAAGSGFLSRLKLLLENSLRNQGQIPVPEGYLRANFWMS